MRQLDSLTSSRPQLGASDTALGLGSRRLGRSLALALVLALGGLASSCVGLLELEGYAGAVGELCAQLTTCYGEAYFPGCVAHADPRLAAASVDVRASWLRTFADEHCLENCINARSCLDIAPVCGDVGLSCGQSEQCCGFTTGFNECANGSCCARTGAPCSAAVPCCADECINDVCGGVPCAPPGSPCVEGFECCTEICNPESGLCSEEVCRPEGAPCVDGIDCCSGFCDLGVTVESEGGAGVFAVAPCLPRGAPCTGAGDCCDGECVEVDATTLVGDRVCSSADCIPEGVQCSDNTECCSGSCDPDFGRCSGCRDPGESCSEDGECCSNTCGDGDACCAPDGSPCLEPGECCSGECGASLKCGDGNCRLGDAPCTQNEECCSGDCAADGTCCSLAQCNHTLCQTGGPLSASCGVAAETDAACIASVCEVMPACCCHRWTDACILVAANECGYSCPDPL
jgi:hypothetical protein